MLTHLVNQHSVFLLRPRTLHHLRVKHLLPAMETLHVRPMLQTLGNSLPVLRPHLSHKLAQFFVLN
jgi:hypothetical protein